MKKIFLVGCLGLLFVSLVFSISVPAQIPQPTPTNQNLKQLLTYLNQQVQYLKDIAQQYPNPELDELIGKIETYCQNALQAQQLGQYRRAMAELLLAQQLMDQAFKLIMVGPVTRLQEQLDEQIRIAEEAIHRNFNSEAQQLLQQAKENRKRAEKAFQSKNVERSVEWLRIALFQATKALELVSAAGNIDLMGAIHEEKANFNELLHRAENLLQERPIGMAQELFNQAFTQQKKAEAAFSRGQVKQAIEMYRWSARLLLRVIDLSGATEINWQQKANEEIDLTRESLRAIEQSVNLQQHSRLNQLYQQAMKVYLDAENSCSVKNYPEAVKKAELSRRILNRANQLVEQKEGGNPVRLTREMETLRSLLAELEKDINSQENSAAAQMIEVATKYLNQSEQAQQANLPFLAQANLFVATRFAYSAKSLSQSQTAEEDLMQLALGQFELFKDRLANITQQYVNKQDDQVHSWLGLAADILRIAETAKANGQYLLLIENVRVGLKLLDRIENRMLSE